MIPKRPQKAVIDGKPTYTSASSLQSSDPESDGCPRKWFFQKVLGLKSPSTKSQALGVKTHKEIEHYLLTGELTLGAIAMAGKHLIPEPDDSYLVEHRIWDQQLAPAGIPIEGYIDLVLPPHKDFSDVVEVIDWKTTSNLKWAKSGSDLPKTIQMGIYAKWALDFYKTNRVRLSHVYFQSRGMPQAIKSTIVVDGEQIERKWESIEGVARSLYHYAAETDVAKVPPNRAACGNFGGCPFFNECPRSGAEVLFDMSVEHPPNGFDVAVNIILQAERGFPPVDGPVAGWVPEGWPTQGAGELGGLPSLHDPQTIIELAKELKREESKAMEALAEVYDSPEVHGAPEVLPPEAPESDPDLAADPVQKPVPTGVASLAEAKKMNKGPLLEAYESCFEALMDRVDLGVDLDGWQKVELEGPPVVITEFTEANTIYVNCQPSEPFPRLEPYVFHTARKLADAAKAPDIRSSDKKAMAFGAWKGALTAAVLEDLPQGSYVVTCKGDELAEIVVAALQGSHQIVRGY